MQKTDRTTFELFNILGQRVTVLFDDVAESGQYYKIELNANAFASGIYFYRLQSGKWSVVKKMAFLK